LYGMGILHLQRRQSFYSLETLETENFYGNKHNGL